MIQILLNQSGDVCGVVEGVGDVDKIESYLKIINFKSGIDYLNMKLKIKYDNYPDCFIQYLVEHHGFKQIPYKEVKCF